uniref:Pre-mRNA-splicing regulator WTAP n=1 Tax=Phallusia mammillata TaxID=59560 RepID=A0A6F9DWE9_9ASCI|nr:pre-mRNA-splicing regulator WTAP-like [Phallusia mammillata]
MPEMGDLSPPPSKRIKKEEISELSKEDLLEKFQKQQEYVAILEGKLATQGGEECEEKEKNHNSEASRRENVLVMRLASKEQEVQDYAAQISVMKKTQDDAAILSLRQANLDPGVNLLFGKMREELQQTKDKLEQAQSELSAWKFTPDSQNGKKLMARCRTLIAENQELGRQLSQGKSAQLEAELALQKKYSEELKASQDELNEFVIQLDEEVEGMQSTIQVLQQQLADTKKDLEHYQGIIQDYESKQLMDSPMESDGVNDDDDQDERRGYIRGESGQNSEDEQNPSDIENDVASVSDHESNMDRTSELDYDEDVDDRTHPEICDIGFHKADSMVSPNYDSVGAREGINESKVGSPGTPTSESMQSVPRSPGTPTEESMGLYDTWDKGRNSGDAWDDRTNTSLATDDANSRLDIEEQDSVDPADEPDIKAHIKSVRSPEAHDSNKISDVENSHNLCKSSNADNMNGDAGSVLSDEHDVEITDFNPTDNGHNELKQYKDTPVEERLNFEIARNGDDEHTPPDAYSEVVTKSRTDVTDANHVQNGVADEEI